MQIKLQFRLMATVNKLIISYFTTKKKFSKLLHDVLRAVQSLDTMLEKLHGGITTVKIISCDLKALFHQAGVRLALWWGMAGTLPFHLNGRADLISPRRHAAIKNSFGAKASCGYLG